MVIRILFALGCTVLLCATAQAQDGGLGKSVFEKKGNCATCHGPTATGTPLAPSLRDSAWVNIDGSLDQIRQLVRTGVAKPKKHPGLMPPMGGAKLKDAEIDAVAKYVHDLQQNPAKDQANAAAASGHGACACCAGDRQQAHGRQAHAGRGHRHGWWVATAESLL